MGCQAVEVLGNALFANERLEEALPVLEVNLALRRRFLPREAEDMLKGQTNLANCLACLGRRREALILAREVYSRTLAWLGASHKDTIGSGCNLAVSLEHLGYSEESKSLLRDQLPAARRSL